MITWQDAITRLIKPGRAVLTKLPRGATIGSPGDAEQQRRLLETALQQLTRPLPTPPVITTETLTNE